MPNSTSQPLRCPSNRCGNGNTVIELGEDLRAAKILEREHRVIERVAAACGTRAQALEEGAEAISNRATSDFAVERQSA
jgi:hypothetical protein